MRERIDKLIASQGRYSRSEVKKMLRAGRIACNGIVVRDAAAKADPACDRIEIMGEPLQFRRFLYLMLNKPAGVVSASRDASLPTVLDLVPDEWKRDGLFPAGRLDRDTTGFVLITDDGDLAHRILSPKNHIEKIYQAELAHPVTADDVAAFRAGITLTDGFPCLPATVRMLEEQPRPLAEIRLHEGKYHQIKRMFAARGNRVVSLRRTAMGGLTLDASLAPGACRLLTDEEVALLMRGMVPLADKQKRKGDGA